MFSYILVTFELGFVKIEHFYLKIADFQFFNFKGQNAPMEFKLEIIFWMEMPLGKIRGNRIALLLKKAIYLPEDFIFMKKSYKIRVWDNV